MLHEIQDKEAIKILPVLRFKIPYSQDYKNKAEARLDVETGLNTGVQNAYFTNNYSYLEFTSHIFKTTKYRLGYINLYKSSSSVISDIQISMKALNV